MGMSVWGSVHDSPEQFHFGLRDFTRDLPMNADTKYRSASVSKSVTALGLIKLYSDGLFDLDDDVSD
jgi:CubicO group peptidase (beta-lactamase class C family)